jgi:catechol 2,3-dioxygenase-like lactoylglutathione lyase family enzyme
MRSKESRMKAKISLVTLGVRDFSASLRFYRDGLGFNAHNYAEGDDHVMFAMEGTWLSLYPRDKLADDATVPDDRAGFSGVTLAHNVGSKAEVEAVFAQAVEAGARAVKPPQDVFWGGYHAYFADPDGQLWEVAFNPFTDLT